MAEGGESHNRYIRLGAPLPCRPDRRDQMTHGVPIGSPKGVPMSAPELRSSQSVLSPSVPFLSGGDPSDFDTSDSETSGSSASDSAASVFAPSVFAETVSRLRAAGCVFAEEEARLLLGDASGPGELAASIERRIAGYPLEHILGWAEFGGLRIAVDPGVFVPRRRTGLLVDEAVALLQADCVSSLSQLTDVGGSPPAVVADLCCGSGAVGVAIASRVEGIELHAADIDPGAVACARRNVARLGGRVHEGDLYDALPPRLKGRARLLVVNAPYVPTEAIGAMPHEARIHESRIALDGGTDGLDLHRRIASGAPEWLAPGGHLLVETSERQAAGTAGIMAEAGFGVRVVHSEELDGTVVIGR